MTGIKHGVTTSCALCYIAMCSFSYATSQELNLNSRIRYAELEDGGNEGRASSVRLRAGLRSSWTSSWSSTLEADYIANGFKNEHSDGVRFNGKPLIPDTPGSEINQLYSEYKTPLMDARLGRQRIEFDNQRFVGSVSFWQNEQTFDAFFSQFNLLSSSKFNYSYIWNTNRIFGEDAGRMLSPNDLNYDVLDGQRPAERLGDHRHDSHLVRFEFNEWDFSRLVFYSYLIETQDHPKSTSDNFGASYALKIKPSIMQYRAEIEAATQKRTEIAEQPRPSYLLAEVAVAYRSLEVAARQERIGSDKGTAFFATLGSGHDFQGWADVFGQAPPEGLTDRSLRVSWRAAPWKIDIRYHQFLSNQDSQNLGTELDIDVIYKPTKDQSLILRFANYQAAANDASRDDRRRIIMTYSFKFDYSF